MPMGRCRVNKDTVICGVMFGLITTKAGDDESIGTVEFDRFLLILRVSADRDGRV